MPVELITWASEELDTYILLISDSLRNFLPLNYTSLAGSYV